MDVDFLRTAGCSACYSNYYEVYFELDDCSFVVIEVAVVRC